MASLVKVDPGNNNAKGQGQVQPSRLPNLNRRQNTPGEKVLRPRKIDRRSSRDKSLSKMAKRPLYDLVPRNSEIHNFTSVKLTVRQSSPTTPN